MSTPVLDLHGIPEYLRNLSTLVFAWIAPDGTIIDANRGFLLQAGLDTPPPEAWNARDLFVNPAFSHLTGTISSAHGSIIYQGILNIGDHNAVAVHSVHGTVYRLPDRLLIVGEPDILALEHLNAMVLSLNDEMAEMHRNLVRNNNELKRNEARIRELMLTDPLTGLANRRRLNESLAQGIGRCQRHDRPMSVLMADIDHFKKVNDTYGHDVGDEVIRMMANCLRDGIRANDLAARFGGRNLSCYWRNAHWMTLYIWQSACARTFRIRFCLP
ncbi:MAG: GGDEF domain-containing protein [Sulfuricella denitrificans]|nr:GGDEF domain-containing protein [Sulfuricella denitrificans]